MIWYTDVSLKNELKRRKKITNSLTKNKATLFQKGKKDGKTGAIKMVSGRASSNFIAGQEAIFLRNCGMLYQDNIDLYLSGSSKRKDRLEKMADNIKSLEDLEEIEEKWGRKMRQNARTYHANRESLENYYALKEELLMGDIRNNHLLSRLHLDILYGKYDLEENISTYLMGAGSDYSFYKYQFDLEPILEKIRRSYAKEYQNKGVIV